MYATQVSASASNIQLQGSICTTYQSTFASEYKKFWFAITTFFYILCGQAPGSLCWYSSDLPEEFQATGTLADGCKHVGITCLYLTLRLHSWRRPLAH